MSCKFSDMPTDPTERDPENVRTGATIAALREAYGMSKTDLARLIDVSLSLVSLIESGHRKATPAVCRAIADKLNIPLAAITVEGYADEPVAAAS